MSRRILITSGKGGAGKTSVTAHLGYALSNMGKRVVAVDMDVGLNNLDVVMGVENKVIYDLKDALEGRCRIKQTLIECSPTLSVIPSAKGFDRELSGKNVKDLTEGLSTRFDYVFIDSPAGVDTGFRRAVCSCDEVILVVTPTLTSLRDADKVLGILNNYDVEKTGIVVNRIRGDLLVKGAIVDIKEIQAVLKCPVIGCIPEDDSVYLCSGLNLYRSRAQKAFKMLAKYLDKGKGKVYDATAYYRGVSGAIRRAIRGSV